MNTYPKPHEAASLWTFGRETPVDGDTLAFELMWERRTRNYFGGLLKDFSDPARP